jgi:glyoxylase-like metal-dependent hydrolase (beta-lactamase superfamily II)/rhodanese-related sulfurtransferase
MAPKRPGLKQFRNEGCLSYVLWDPASRDAAVIDPVVDLMEDYRELVAARGLKIRYALDTHTHADHYSATHLFRAEYGAEIAMGASTQSARATVRLKDGDTLRIGSFSIQAMDAPGHTPDTLCYRADGSVFTGDTLFIGSSGRTDFPGADPGQLFDSLHARLGALPDATLVFPGHDYNDLLFSTIGTEKKHNPHLRMESRDEFSSMKKAEQLGSGAGNEAEIRKRIEFNLSASPGAAPACGPGQVTRCGAPTDDSSQDNRASSIGVEKYWNKLQEHTEGTAFLDVREPEEFAEGHMPRVTNIPLSELGYHLAELSSRKRVYASCLSGRRSGMAAKTLAYLGLPDVVNVNGGFKAWSQAGLPVTREDK